MNYRVPIRTSNTKAIYHQNKAALKNIVFTNPNTPEPEMLKEDNIKDLGN